VALSELLGGLPLAHEQAAAYCERLDIALADYAKRFEPAPVKFLDDVRDAPLVYNDGRTVARTFALATDEAAKLHPAAEPLIVHAALLAPEPIPLFLFSEARDKLGERLASLLADDGLDEAVAALRTFALLDRETIADERESSITTDCIRLHRLVRQIAASRRNDEARKTMWRTLIEAVAWVYPELIWRDPQTWPRVRRLDPLALALIGDAPIPSAVEKSVSDLLILTGQYRQSALADYAGAKPLYERALAIQEKELGPEHARISATLSNLTNLLRAQGDLAAARPLYERALAIDERVHGFEHPETATQLNNLALLLQDQDDLAAAQPHHERALAIREKVLGPEHPDTAGSLNNLAALLLEKGDLAGSRQLFERALVIREKVEGPEHPDTAQSLNNLAQVLQDQGDLAGARSLYARALTTWHKVLGPEHPETNRGRGNFAEALLASGNASEALSHAEGALAAHAKVLGPNHSWTKDSARVTADALDALGRADDATALRERHGLRDSAS
jgi:tetratricopeptide (TPR) repeat protein